MYGRQLFDENKVVDAGCNLIWTSNRTVGKSYDCEVVALMYEFYSSLGKNYLGKVQAPSVVRLLIPVHDIRNIYILFYW